MRVAAITAAANGDTEVGEACMRAALRLMEWQGEIRSIYKPSRADSMGGRYSEMIMNEAWRHQDIEGNFLPFSWREAYRRNSWYTKDGNQVQKQRDILVGLGMLIKVEDPAHPKKVLYRAANWSKEQRSRGIEQAAELYAATSADLQRGQRGGAGSMAREDVQQRSGNTRGGAAKWLEAASTRGARAVAVCSG